MLFFVVRVYFVCLEMTYEIPSYLEGCLSRLLT